MPTRVRAAGALILLIGIGITRVLQLTTDDITIADNGQVSIVLGRQPIPLPPRVGTLVTQLVEQREHVSTLKPTNRATLLFPGRPPSRPLNPQAFSHTLIRYGITVHTGRNAALLDLASDVPAPILADLLGIGASTAGKWNTITGRHWTAYLQARAEQSSLPAHTLG